ncbi:MAG: rhomboid family intramembrane serine protease [Alcanivoracaceae bacterium]|nr:rhomboid family intramembrane serine protease [Alcanivoracaceae bacterium]
MLPKPDVESLDGKLSVKQSLKTVPWVCLAFFVAYLSIFLVYQKDEQQDQLVLAQWYQKSGLFELEWENYISWLRISGQVKKADALQQARTAKDTLTVFRAMAFDPSFERENRLRGDQYWNSDQRIKWEQTRQEFSQRSAELPSVRFGLNPQTPRPSTYLTWHFLHDSLWQWLVALLVLAPFAWAVEGTVGAKRMAILWISSGIAAGLSYVAFVPWGYQPLVGATPITSAIIGMFLGLFALRKIPFVYFNPKQKSFADIMLPGAIIAPLWLVLPIYEYYGGSDAPFVWVSQLAALIAGFGLVQLARPADVAGTEQEQSDDTDDNGHKQLRQHLTSAWASMSALSFMDAETEFKRAIELSPGHFIALSGLYQIYKLDPEAERFHSTALDALQANVDNEGEIRQQLSIYRDYIKFLDEEQSLPLDTEIKLLMRFTRLGELKDAEKLAVKINKSGANHALLEKALSALGQAFAQHNNSTKAAHFASLAENVKMRK